MLRDESGFMIAKPPDAKNFFGADPSRDRISMTPGLSWTTTGT
jgi:hypothetical protein